MEATTANCDRCRLYQPQPTNRALVCGLWLLFACAGLLAACTSATPTLYLPPTLAPQASPPALPTVTPPAPTPTSPPPACTDGLAFVQDLTIPDGALVSPGALLDKRWQVENSGTCNWDERYSLRLVTGPDLGARPQQALYPARGGTEAALRVFFTAPTEPGIYQSAWRAHDPQGNPFGDLFFIYIQVEPLPTPQP